MAVFQKDDGHKPSSVDSDIKLDERKKEMPDPALGTDLMDFDIELDDSDRVEGKERKGDGKLELSEAEEAYVKGLEIPGIIDWKAKLSEDAALAPLCRHLEGKEPLSAEGLQRYRTLLLKTAMVDGILVTRRPLRREVEEKVMVVVPNRRRVQLIAECHDAEHRSAAHTHDQISQAGFWWPGASQDVKEYVKSWCAARTPQGTKEKACGSGGVWSPDVFRVCIWTSPVL